MRSETLHRVLGRVDRRRVLATAAVGAMLIGTAGCAGSEQPHALALIDTTGSTSGGTVKICRTALRHWAAGVATEQGDLRADVLDARTSGTPTWPVHEHFSIPAADQSNSETLQDDLRKQLGSLDRQVSNLLAGNPSGGPTPFVAALYGAGQVFGTESGKKELWVCSDARDSRLPAKLTIARADRVLIQISSDGLPNLHGVDVWINTVTVQGRRGLGIVGQSALEHFVKEVVARAGGHLVAYGPYAGS